MNIQHEFIKRSAASLAYAFLIRFNALARALEERGDFRDGPLRAALDFAVREGVADMRAQNEVMRERRMKAIYALQANFWDIRSKRIGYEFLEAETKRWFNETERLSQAFEKAGSWGDRAFRYSVGTDVAHSVLLAAGDAYAHYDIFLEVYEDGLPKEDRDAVSQTMLDRIKKGQAAYEEAAQELAGYIMEGKTIEPIAASHDFHGRILEALEAETV